MILPCFAVRLFSVGVLVLGAGVVFGQTASTSSGQAYPNKPIRIVTTLLGGGNDIEARLIAPSLSAALGQPVIIDNRPSGVIPGSIVSKAPPDGYTLLIVSGGFWMVTLLQDNVPYDPVKDFSTITSIDRDFNVLVVNPASPVNSVKDLIALAKAKPGELNYASAGTGASAHLSAELFKALAGISMVRIAYTGTAMAFNDLLGGRVQLMFPSAGSVAPQVKSGRLRALAVTGGQQSTRFPGLPTMAAAGVPGYEFTSISGMFAPAKTPDAIIRRLNQEVVRALNQEDLKEKFLNTGVEAATGSPEDLAAKVKSEIAKWTKVVKDAGIRAD